MPCCFCDTESVAVGETSQGEEYCESCAYDIYRCYYCNTRFHSEEPADVAGHYACPSCADALVVCDGCGVAISDEEAEYEDGLAYCSDCSRDSSLIHDYGYEPRPRFYGRGPLYLGVELEVNSRSIRRDAEQVTDVFGDRVYLKHDSSIGDGFEIVTHPHSPAELRELLNEDALSDLPDTISSYDSGLCGMHVHVSRAALTKLQLAKMACFMHCPDNLSFIETIAQRSIHKWARQRAKTLTEHESVDRYEALNLTPAKTVEFRIFRGNLRHERIWKGIEFVLALIDYARDCSLKALSHHDFIRWLDQNRRKDYRNLIKFLEANKLMKGRKVKCV